MQAFLLLDEQNLKDIGVSTMGARKKIFNAILSTFLAFLNQTLAYCIIFQNYVTLLENAVIPFKFLHLIVAFHFGAIFCHYFYYFNNWY